MKMKYSRKDYIEWYYDYKIHYNERSNNWYATNGADEIIIEFSSSKKQLKKLIREHKEKRKTRLEDKLIPKALYIDTFDGNFNVVKIIGLRSNGDFLDKDGERVEKDEIYFDTPKNRKIANQIKELDKAQDKFEREISKKKEQLDRALEKYTLSNDYLE